MCLSAGFIPGYCLGYLQQFEKFVSSAFHDKMLLVTIISKIYEV